MMYTKLNMDINNILDSMFRSFLVRQDLAAPRNRNNNNNNRPKNDEEQMICSNPTGKEEQRSIFSPDTHTEDKKSGSPSPRVFQVQQKLAMDVYRRKSNVEFVDVTYL